MKQKKYKVKKDKYTKARGGSSKFLTISCAKCNTEVLLYQKDGPGRLLRMYLDKIHAPEDLIEQASKFNEKKDMSDLTCPHCNERLASPMVYASEDRLAYRVIKGAIKKEENNKGVFPKNLSTQNKGSAMKNEKRSFPEIRREVLEVYNDKYSKRVFKIAERMLEPVKKEFSIKENGENKDFTVIRNGLGPLQTPYGDIWLYDFSISDQWEKYSVLVKCPHINFDTLEPVFQNKEILSLRTDSGCETGQLFMDNTCECREQLHETMQNIIDNEEGMIVHIPHQDGRGKGIPFKLATLFLQKELGLNTVESAAYLANKDKIDVRTYAGVVGVLKFFNIDPEITKINLATNNPDKLKVFEENGYTIDNTPLQIKPNDKTRHHLDAKKKYLEHNLGIGDFGRGE